MELEENNKTFIKLSMTINAELHCLRFEQGSGHRSAHLKKVGNITPADAAMISGRNTVSQVTRQVTATRQEYELL